MKYTFQRLIFLIVMTVSCAVHAQTQRSGGDSARIVQQMQQANAEKTRLQQENDALKKELEELKKKSTQASADLAKSQQRLNQLDSEASKQQALATDKDAALEKSKTQLQEFITKFRATAQSLKDVEAERDAQIQDKLKKDKELTRCVDKNAQLYLLSNEVIDRMEGQSLWSVIRTKEPFTQLSRARLENLVDDYRGRIGELKQIKPISEPVTASSK